MTVDREPLQGLGTRVDETQTMGFATFERELGQASSAVASSLVIRGQRRAVEVILAIDEIVIRKDDTGTVSRHDSLDEVHIRCMIPIVKQDRANVNVIVAMLARTMDDNGTDETSGVLGRVVRVIPR